MENLNKLSFRYKEIDISKIEKEASSIKFNLDNKGEISYYYFKIEQIVPIDTRGLGVEIYLQTDSRFNNEIYRMILDELPIIDIKKIVPGYTGSYQDLPIEQQYIVKYTWFEEYTKINLGLKKYYMIVLGYPTQLRWENDYMLRLKNIKFIQDFRVTDQIILEDKLIITSDLEGVLKSHLKKYKNIDNIYFKNGIKNIYKT